MSRTTSQKELHTEDGRALFQYPRGLPKAPDRTLSATVTSGITGSAGFSGPSGKAACTAVGPVPESSLVPELLSKLEAFQVNE